MQLLPSDTPSPFEQTFVALDLETTGLDPDRDEVIEVAAVKFQGDTVLQTYSTLVNPYRALPPVVRRLTGITQEELQGAPPFAAVAGELEAFLGGLPLVGHNVAFDVAFLERRNIGLSPVRYDTWDLASLLMPQRRRNTLASLGAAFAIPHSRAHRALSDAEVTHRLFVALLRQAAEMDAGTLAEVGRLADRGQWSLGGLLAGLKPTPSPARVAMNLDDLRQRLTASRPLRQGRDVTPVEEGELEALVEPDGPLSRALLGYERREEQVRMMQQVAAALNQGQSLMVEGGTGIGKSLAYLIPAALFAHRNRVRVVISTNTINLQEQLITKDIPIALQSLGLQEADGLQVAHLKGKANYLCLRRWSQLRAADTLSAEEARFLSKTLVWLQSTSTGDRSEVNLLPPEGRLWDGASARWAQPGCLATERVCFLRAARERAEAAHVLVVNHALLLADAAMGGGLLPEYEHLIVDEAHHLEEEATEQFGFRVSQESQAEALGDLIGPRGLLARVRAFLSRRGVPPARRDRLTQELLEVEGEVAGARASLERLYQVLGLLVGRSATDRDGANRQIWLTLATRAQADWSRLKELWEEAHHALGGVVRRLEQGQEVVREFAAVDPVLAEALQSDLATQAQDLRDSRDHLREVLAEPQQGMVYWIAQEGRDANLVLQGAPLEVGPLLQERLYQGKRSVILTGATLTTQGSFDHLRERVGLEGALEHVEGSPFDYRRCALLLAPSDIPEPAAPGYPRALALAVADLARAAQGRTMVLFTSHASLRAVQRSLLELLEGEGIQVLAQGVDGSPQRVLEAFQEEARSVLLGTSSFWEGVDVPAGVLKVLALARLPFSVPTDPIFAARSEQFENPFSQYAVPQAVLRFRQGFGRLIRRREDRGVVVVLDRRLRSRSYGASFLRSIPSCTFKAPPLGGLAEEVRRWIEG